MNEIEKFLGGKLKETLKKIRKGLENEGRQTKEMVKIYLKYSNGEATEEEMTRANKQFRDFLKTIGLGALAVLPFAPVTIPAIVKLGKQVGIDIIPDSFKENPSDT